MDPPWQSHTEAEGTPNIQQEHHRRNIPYPNDRFNTHHKQIMQRSPNQYYQHRPPNPFPGFTANTRTMPVQHYQPHRQSFQPRNQNFSHDPVRHRPRIQQHPPPRHSQPPLPPMYSSPSANFPNSRFLPPPQPTPQQNYVPHSYGLQNQVYAEREIEDNSHLSSVSHSEIPQSNYEASSFHAPYGEPSNYQQTNTGFHIPSIQDCVKIEKNEIQNQDSEWLKQWLNTRKKAKDEVDSSIKIPEAKSLLKDTFLLLEELTTIQDNLKSENVDEKERSQLLLRANEIKENIESIKQFFDSTTKMVLQRKVLKRRKFREKSRQRKKQKYEEKIKNEETRKELHYVIDKWQERIYEEVEEKKREQELKSIADKTLAEVRRKCSDATKGLELLKSLRKLRNVRKDSMERKGLYTPKESDLMFEARLKRQTEILEKQLKSYEAENRLIQVMLDTEEQECKEYEEEELKNIKEEKEKELEFKIKEVLFGKDALKGPPAPTDPLFRFYVYQDASNQNVENFVQIRREWDSFLVSDDTTLGSELPQTWVIPAEPSSEVWASALAQ